jgi:acetyl-CoA carboxylase beta subunit
MTTTALTAEWLCTKCGASNRKLVMSEITDTVDRCYHCKAAHEIRAAERKVYWTAKAK